MVAAWSMLYLRKPSLMIWCGLNSAYGPAYFPPSIDRADIVVATHILAASVPNSVVDTTNQHLIWLDEADDVVCGGPVGDHDLVPDGHSCWV